MSLVYHFLFLFLGLLFEVQGIEGTSQWGAQEVQERINKVVDVFHYKYPQDSYRLRQGDKPIGALHFEGDTAFVTVRGSRGIQELVSSMYTNPYALYNTGLPLQGAGHEGYCKEFTSLKQSLKNQIFRQLREHEEKQRISLGELKIKVQGASKGAAWATFVAALLRSEEETKNAMDLSVLTYAGANIFDHTGTDSYNALVGKRKHLSLLAQEDQIAQYANLSTNESLGTLVSFSAHSLDGYKQRIYEHKFTNMIPLVSRLLNLEVCGFNIASSAVLPILGKFGAPVHLLEPDSWEAHVDSTYQEWADHTYR